MEQPDIQALSPLRHSCLGCGGSCHGVRVRLFPDEVASIENAAISLGVSDPIVDGRVRQDAGQCAFLDAHQRCRIHANLGSERKPRICKQYPIALVRTETEVRAGIDPGCYTAFQTWHTAPEIDVEAYGAAESTFDAGAIRQEAALLRLLHAPNASIPSLLRALCPGEPDAVGLPIGLRERWASRWENPAIAALLADAHTGPSLRRGIQPLLAASESWSPPPVSLPAGEAEAWALEVCKRMLYLRLLPNYPGQAVALMTLLGAVSAHWAGPAHFAPGLAAWVRALRAPAFWAAFVADPHQMMWLATGQSPPRARIESPEP